MPTDKMKGRSTAEIPTRKVSLTKRGSMAVEPRKGGVIGWECTPPQIGQPYSIYLYDGMVLRTSLVQEIQRAEKSIIVKTKNSVYQLEYLSDDQQELPHEHR